MKRLLSVLLTLALLVGFACAEGAVTVTDMTGREVSLYAPAERIVALTAADCEILYAIGAGDKLVGRGEYCDYPEAVLALPSLQSGSETNIEQILALEPDVVVMGTMDQSKEQVLALENAGVAVVVTDAQDIAGVYDAISLLGALVGSEDGAQAVIASMQTAFQEFSDSCEATGKTVYFEVSPLEYGLWTAGEGTFMNEIAEMLGLENAFADVSGWAEISEEQVLERNPDYIITITMYFGEGPTPVEEILAREGWQELRAVENLAVFNADSNSISRPGPRLKDAAEELYSFVYGE